MDDRHGHFVPLPKEEAEQKLNSDMTKGRVFQVGELLRVKESLFRVKAIKPTELRLKLLPEPQKPMKLFSQLAAVFRRKRG